MKKILTCLSAFMAIALYMTNEAYAQVGNPYIHDPSTIVECDGKYYTFGTGGGGLISEDGWTWESGAVRPGGGVAPDAIKIGDRYMVVYAATERGAGNGHKSRVYMMWNKTLDPNSPDFKYTDPIDIAGSDGIEDCDGIDPGLMMGPDGRLWLTYGTYFGYIRIVEMDPVTGLCKEGSEPVDVALSCEAPEMIYQDGWYYLLATHGTCCDGANSTYNIIVGRSKSPTGPYYDNVGRDMIHGGGKLVLATEKRLIGAGHFGRFTTEEGVEKMSLHFEADLDRGGRSVLAIRPIVWKNGWPVAGELVEDGEYGIISERRGYALELGVKSIRMPGGMRGFGGPAAGAPVEAMEDQKLEDVIGTWPEGNIELRIGADMFRPHQNWLITEVPEVGGYLGGAYYKITIAGTDRVLAATAEKEVTTLPEYTGGDEQLWKIEMLTDGTYRIMPKAVPGTDEPLALISIGDSTPTLGKFDFNSDNSKWNLRRH